MAVPRGGTTGRSVLVNARVSHETYARLTQHAASTGETMSDLIRQAVAHILDQRDGQQQAATGAGA